MMFPMSYHSLYFTDQTTSFLYDHHIFVVNFFKLFKRRLPPFASGGAGKGSTETAALVSRTRMIMSCNILKSTKVQ